MATPDNLQSIKKKKIKKWQQIFKGRGKKRSGDLFVVCPSSGNDPEIWAS